MSSSKNQTQVGAVTQLGRTVTNIDTVYKEESVFRFDWKVKKCLGNAKQLCEWKSYTSPNFNTPISDGKEDVQWHLKLEMNPGVRCSLFWKAVVCPVDAVNCEVSVEVINDWGSVVRSHHGGMHPYKQGSSRGYPNFVTREMLADRICRQRWFPAGSLNIVFTIAVIANFVSCKKSSLSSDLLKLFEREEAGKDDIAISVGEETFFAHKLVLMARSQVFCSMLQSDMSESRENKIEIKDALPEVIKEMIHYMYTDEVRDLERLAKGLLEVSVKYMLGGLKRICGDYLAKHIGVSNAAELLMAAELYDMVDMKRSCISFINANIAAVVKTTQFNVLASKYPAVVAEAYKQLGNSPASTSDTPLK